MYVIYRSPMSGSYFADELSDYKKASKKIQTHLECNEIVVLANDIATAAMDLEVDVDDITITLRD